MIIKVDFIAPHGPVKGCREIEVQMAPGSTIADLIVRLCEIYGEAARELILQPDGKTPFVVFWANNKRAGLDYTIRPGDAISVLPPIGGG